MNNLVNLVAKLYAGFLVLVTMWLLIIGEGYVDSDDLGSIAIIGMVFGFGIIMIGELYKEIKAYMIRNNYIRRSKKEKREIVEKKEEAAQ